MMATTPIPKVVEHTDYIVRSDIPFQIIDRLGQGAYGVVDKVQRGSQLYARKTLTVNKHQKQKVLEQISNEVKLVSNIEHKHIVKLVETYACGLEFSMIMEPVADGNLAEFIQEFAEGPRDRTALEMIPEWFGCLSSGLAYIHSQNIHHRDIKPQNLLHLGRKILFADFGIARKFVENTISEYTAVAGSRNYWAPELDEEIRPGRKADVFSLGLVFLEMLAIYATVNKLPELWCLRPYSRNLAKIHDWITKVDMHPIEAEWYPTMIFLCRHMLCSSKADRPYADTLAACWNYQPFTVVPPTSCSCSMVPVDYSVASMTNARQKAEARGDSLTLQLLFRRGSSIDPRTEGGYKKHTISLSQIIEVSAIPSAELVDCLVAERSGVNITRKASRSERGTTYSAACATEQENTGLRAGLRVVETQLAETQLVTTKPVILDHITLRNPIAIVGGLELTPKHVSDQSFFPLDLPFPVTLFNFRNTTADVNIDGRFYLYSDPDQAYGMSSLLFPLQVYRKIMLGKSDGIFYEVRGEENHRVLAVEWYLFQSMPGKRSLHFRLLYEEDAPNIVQFSYYNVPNPGTDCAVGVQGSGTSDVMHYNAEFLCAGLRLHIDTVKRIVVEERPAYGPYYNEVIDNEITPNRGGWELTTVWK